MATVPKGSRSADIHKQLDHPVVDGDAHWLESIPVFHEYVRTIGGQGMLDDYIKTQSAPIGGSRRPRRAVPATHRPAELLVRSRQHARPRHVNDSAPHVRAAG